jgi:hypothetical protein
VLWFIEFREDTKEKREKEGAVSWEMAIRVEMKATTGRECQLVGVCRGHLWSAVRKQKVEPVGCCFGFTKLHTCCGCSCCVMIVVAIVLSSLPRAARVRGSVLCSTHAFPGIWSHLFNT